MRIATNQYPVSSAASRSSHLLIKPAVPGTPIKLNPPITKAAEVNGIDLPRPLKLLM